LRLEPGDPPADDRFRHAHPLCGAREGAGFHHPDEGEDVEQIDRRAFHNPQHRNVK
jgi:hypothetical protein